MWFFLCENYLVLLIISEVLILPLIVLILGFGGQVHKVQASFYLLFFSIMVSFPGLVTYLFIETLPGRFPLEGRELPPLVLLLLVFMFLMKLPVYFLHYWLPLVHVEAPTSTRVYLASVLLKLGV
jgi:NADH:ubiquinone oxidoreductase subunit 4 (subunit M)